jgi:hypothetical protein
VSWIQSTSMYYKRFQSFFFFVEKKTTPRYTHAADSAAAMAAYYTSDYYHMIAGQADPRLSWTCLEILDWVRFFSLAPCQQQEQCGVPGVGYLLTAPGIPIVFYGLEQGFNGQCALDRIDTGNATQRAALSALCRGGADDALKRQDMWAAGAWRLGAAVASVSALAGITANTHTANTLAWTADPFLARAHALYGITRALIYMRRSCVALTEGAMYWRFRPTEYGSVGIFSRIAGTSEIVMVINPAAKEQELPDGVTVDATLHPSAGVKFVNLFDMGQAFVTAVDGMGVSPSFLANAYLKFLSVHKQHYNPYIYDSIHRYIYLFSFPVLNLISCLVLCRPRRHLFGHGRVSCRRVRCDGFGGTTRHWARGPAYGGGR